MAGLPSRWFSPDYGTSHSVFSQSRALKPSTAQNGVTPGTFPRPPRTIDSAVFNTHTTSMSKSRRLYIGHFSWVSPALLFTHAQGPTI